MKSIDYIYITLKQRDMKNLNINTNIDRRNLESLILDLNFAWNTRNDVVTENLDIIQETECYKILLNTSNFINAIDPGSMDLLKSIIKDNGTYSLSSLAKTLIN